LKILNYVFFIGAAINYESVRDKKETEEYMNSEKRSSQPFKHRCMPEG
jgi:hypothetical protein